MIEYKPRSELERLGKYEEMTFQESKESIFDELDNSYRGANFTKDDRDRYLSILNKCLEISETEYPVNGINKCKITTSLCHPARNGNGTYFELTGSVNSEARLITGHIYDDIAKYDSEIYVEMYVYRCLPQGELKKYTVFTKFYLEDLYLELMRETEYPQKQKKIIENIGKNDIIKGGKNENKRY